VQISKLAYWNTENLQKQKHLFTSLVTSFSLSVIQMRWFPLSVNRLINYISHAETSTLVEEKTDVLSSNNIHSHVIRDSHCTFTIKCHKWTGVFLFVSTINIQNVIVIAHKIMDFKIYGFVPAYLFWINSKNSSIQKIILSQLSWRSWILFELPNNSDLNKESDQ
jgi:hypothetical protein